MAEVNIREIDLRPVERTRSAFVENGMKVAIAGQPSRWRYWPKLDGKGEAKLLAFTCGEGHQRWTLKLLGEQLVKLEVVDSISDNTLRTAKKNELKPWIKIQWVILPRLRVSFVYDMEDVPEVYHQPYNEAHPLVCLGETTRQLIGRFESH